ncbi:DUF551 domain-containing protein [Citrobacter koseri]|nr:DUF551 domain-containing protein [Citrobacter koseri]
MDAWNACRAAMLQAGKSPVIPEGLIAAVNRLLDSDGSRGCYSAIRCHDAREGVERLLAAAPHDTPALNSLQSVDSVTGRWIPVSERMPEKGQAVLVYRPKAHEGGDSDVRVAVYGRHNFEHGFGCYWEPSHWMPLPAGPQEGKGE